MIVLPEIDPFVFKIADNVGLRWYGLMYLLGFMMAWYIGKRRLAEISIDNQRFLDLISTIAMGIIVGGRVGYVLLYTSIQWLSEPWLFFMIWKGGMSFHGALVGGLISLIGFAVGHGIEMAKLVDFVAPLVPPGLMMGRLGNFINAELLGRVTDVPWAVVFPNSDLLPRHPSQLYEMLGEGCLLYILLLWHRRSKERRPGVLGFWFLCHYAWIRFILEFFREPDVGVGFVVGNVLSMGQVLSLLMLLLSFSWLYMCYRDKPVSWAF
tara:strand:+ start:1016 stop:1813 length:798 start_codon:yes stop_codon:yes gene_type:complete